LDTRYLKSLLAVVDRGSIADAARAEGLTAAAIGQRIQAMERALDVVLLSRAGHAAQPTPACLSLLPRARRIVSEMAQLSNDAQGEALQGTLRVGAISTALTGLLPGALRRLTVLAPGIKPIIMPGTSRDLYKALQARELDAAILAAPPFVLPKHVQRTVLRVEPLVFLAGPATDGEVNMLLETRPYIRYDPQAWGGRHAAHYLDEHGLTPTVLCDLDALETIAMLVADGMGVSLVPQWSGFERWAGDCRVTPIESSTVPSTAPSIKAQMKPSTTPPTKSPMHPASTSPDRLIAPAVHARYGRELVVLSDRHSERPDLLNMLFQALA